MSITDAVARELTARQLRPATVKAVYVGGSRARGWSHARSDTDVFVVSADRWEGAVAELQPVTVQPDTIPVVEVYVDGQRWELRYWQETQIDQLVERLSWDAFEAGTILMSPLETVSLERLMHALPVDGEQWIAVRQQRIADSALQALMTTRALARADANMEDVAGLLESGDPSTAVIAAQEAFANLVDALAASHGECGLESKWRTRRMRLLNLAVLPYDEYWDITTMRSFDPDKPEAWVRNVIEVCRRLSAEVAIG